ncbi:phenylacetate--CoA ligase [Eggerthellaceae bacterium zg-1084]|uniref:Phenylacetate-coenzyme A ligase n=1 Tax=Berryella wangjianweii TaxID=2734634 RepID=A0A6M8J667_9ACTN|nr:phenylacetate--CoA ligase [Berryella wangjianweii]NPD30272.1 phenylacetate--CoA ligase [Berryella wangjianweii]NPD32575.1 phenylacetate--CoA ligase [Eggerthellaceae bacterium zg-997]QKF06959.1 phenylacetate--CoA ligase [Berryella wangjianweii]
MALYQPELEAMSRDELAKLQFKRARWTVQHAYDNIAFYRELWKREGAEPGDLRSLDDLARFPFIVKQDMRDAYPFGLFAVPQSQVARIHASSGTTGQATVVGSTYADLRNWSECFARGVHMCGGGPGTTVQVSYGYGLFTGGLGAHFGSEAAGCTVIPTSSGNTKRQIQMMRDLGTQIICCTPSYAMLLADTMIEMGIDPKRDLRLHAGIFGAEAASEGLRAQLREKLGIQYCDVYGLSEVMGPGVAFECAEGGGLHLAEDHFLAEVVDPDTLQPVAEGTYGELVFTTLTRECCPLVRYRTRDITRIISEECACGRTHRKIDRIVGRSDDMMIVRGVNVFPSQIEQVITQIPEIATQYKIVLTSDGYLDRMQLQVETVPEFPFDEIRRLEEVRLRLRDELRSSLQIAVDVRLVEPMSIERSEGKAKRVYDMRAKEARR